MFPNLGQQLKTTASTWLVRLLSDCGFRANLGHWRSTGGFSLNRAIRLVSSLLAGMFLLHPFAMAQDWRSGECRAKASFLVAFPNFIDWPEGAFPSEKTPLSICVFGDFLFGTSLAESARGVSVHGRRLEVRWTRKEQELRACQVLFVSRSETRRYGQILKDVQGASVLTVGETSDFLANGGAIAFLVEGDKLQFEVNIEAADDAHLRISSNMLALARHVVRTEAAKS